MHITDDMIKKLCSDMVYRHGDEYYRDGRVHIRKRSETEISAAVDGEELYNVYISFDDGQIKNELCTCTYYQTMHSPCKHMVAVLKQRMAELDEVGYTENENDRIASSLCREFSSYGERKKIRALFELFIKPNRGAGVDPEFEMSLTLPDCGGKVQGLENFLDCYLTYREFKVDRNNTYSRRNMYFPENEDNIIKIMAEVYQTRSSGVELYRKSSSETTFGSAVMRRMFPYLAKLDFKLIFDGISINGVEVVKDDPDILIDVLASGTDIVMSLSESGFAITPNGEWFFYNDKIYNTTSEWRDYFMPIYRSLSNEKRTQITFRGDNAMHFAAHVLPKIRGHQGVILNGVDEIIVNSKPEFSVFLDADKEGISASLVVKYGTMQFRLPSPVVSNDDKIIIRDYNAEDKLIRLFHRFDRQNYRYRLFDDKEIYRFISHDLQRIGEYAQIIMSDSFKHIDVSNDIEIKVNALYDSREDYLEIEFDIDLLPDEMTELLKSFKLKEDYYRTNDGRFINLKNNEKRELLEMLVNSDVTEKELKSGKKKLPKFEMLRLEYINGISSDSSVREYLETIRGKKPVISSDLHGELREYQKDALSWFYELSELGMGGILADDMGLGKTLETLCYIHSVSPKKPALIVAPSTLVFNWQKEIERFLPDAKYMVITGSKEDRKKLIKNIYDYEFIITSYPLLRRDISLYMDMEFSWCVIDEAQYIKNRKTMNALSVKKINAEHRFALTGTPIENSIMELWSIFDFIMPGYFGSAREFSERFINITDDAELSQSLRNLIRPFVLRRMKKDVLYELPEKIETTMTVELTREQKALYKAYVEKLRHDAEGLLHTSGGRMTILTGILRLRQICCHPLLLTESEKATSGKLELLKDLVMNAKSGNHRVLVFSQFRTMIDIIERELAMLGIVPYKITGDVSMRDRVSICERFNNGEGEVILVSLKAGGTGINLTGADTVIHYDPWWNPAVTDQATDRVYRIGQTRAVQVIKLASHGTIEEKILKLELKKRALADDIIQVNTKTLANLTDEEILSLFDI